MQPSVAIPGALMDNTIRAALQIGAGTALEGAVSSSVWALTKAGTPSMMLAKGKLISLIVLSVGIATVGAGGGEKQDLRVAQDRVVKPAKPAPEAAPQRDVDALLQSQIKSLENDQRELQQQVDDKKATLLQLAQKTNIDLEFNPDSGNVKGQCADLAIPNRNKLSIEQYRTVRDELFRTNMELSDLEALLEMKMADDATKSATTKPRDKASTKRVESAVDAAILRDPEMISTIDQLERAAAVLIAKRREPPTAQTAAVEVATANLLQELAERYTRLWALEARGAAAGRLNDLKDKIAGLKVRKGTYEKTLKDIEITNRQDTIDQFKIALAREELTSTIAMKEKVVKRLEQLRYESRVPAKKGN